MIEYYNEDCMIGMSRYPNKHFDLAIVDPPYGIGVGSMSYTNGVKMVGNALAKRKNYRKNTEWDIIPDKKYFEELFRVSNHLIIWGGNYFADMLPPSKSFVCWDKRCSDSMSNDFADCEYAYLSDGMGVARVIRYLWNGMLQGDMKNKEHRIHPTQKPVALYKWLLKNYAKQGDLILDTHVGSASSLIACHDMGFDAVGFELDPEYYKQSNDRLSRYISQMRIDQAMTIVEPICEPSQIEIGGLL